MSHESLVSRCPRLASVVCAWPTPKSAVSGPPCPPPPPIPKAPPPVALLPTPPPPDLLNMATVAARCGRSRGWANKQVATGRLRALRDGRRLVVRPADFEAFLNGLEEA